MFRMTIGRILYFDNLCRLCNLGRVLPFELEKTLETSTGDILSKFLMIGRNFMSIDMRSVVA